jgi:hypothetical protein
MTKFLIMTQRSLFCRFPHFRKKRLITWFFRDVVDVDITNDSLFIDHENCPFGKPFRPLDPIFAGNLTQGIKIAQKRERDAAEAFRPCFEAGDVINTDAQDLGIESRELAKLGFVRRDLVRSDRCPGQGEKCQHHGCFSTESTQSHRFVQVARECKIRSLLPDGHSHDNPPFLYGWLNF